MKRILFIALMLALMCASCKKSGGGSSSETQETPASQSADADADTDTDSSDSTDGSTSNDNVTSKDPPPSNVDTTPPEPAFVFKTNVKFINLTSAQKTKMEKALKIIRLVVATDEFKSKILNHKYNGKKTFVDNGGYTNAQIYQKILDGAETLQPTKDNEMDMEVEMYTASTNVVGYTYANSKRVWVNTKFFNQYTAAGVAHNLFHEWLHKLGFKHASNYTKSRDYSVPYAIGDLVGEIGKDFL